MRTIRRRSKVDASELARLLTPRDDIVGELEDGDQAFRLGDGPFTHYRRQLQVVSPAEVTKDELVDAASQDVEVEVEETIEYRLPSGTWPFPVATLIAGALRRRPADGKLPLWAPPQRPDAQGMTVLMLLATLALVVGYHGTLLGQTMTFIADEFNVSNTMQGWALGLARIGGLLAVVLGALADRSGRRRVLTICLLGCIGSTALGAVTPNLAGLIGTQMVNRGTWAAAVALLGVIAAEEMPAGARAYALGILTMCTALGAGLALAILPVADQGTQAWRVLYAAPLLMIPLVLRYGRLLPETRRYARPHESVRLNTHMTYLILICAAMFLLNMFIGPAPQFRNEFLRDERGFSAGDLSLFAVLTAIPGALGILLGGRLAETAGRRAVASISAVAGAVLVALSFTLAGPSMWLAATVGTMSLAALAPSFTVYNSELFPTSLRGQATGIASMVAMAGSVVGLGAAGQMSDWFGSFGPAMGVIALGPVLMALLVWFRYPETKLRELEDLNPEDRLADGSRFTPPL